MEISAITEELMEQGEMAAYKVESYMLEHKEEMSKLSREESMKKLAEVMLGE